MITYIISSSKESINLKKLMKKSIKNPKFLLPALLTAMALSTAQAQANTATSAPTLAKDSIIDSIDQLGKLSIEVPTTHYFYTDNGVKVAFTPLHELPIVDVSLYFALDAAVDELPAGTTNMAANMLTQGSGSLSEDEFVEASESLGIALSANASKDGLSVSMRSLSDASILNPAADLMAMAINEPNFDAAILKRNQDRLSLSLRQQRQNPAYVAAQAFTQAVYEGHHYAQAISGDEHSLQNITTDDLTRFVDRYFHAPNATLILTGDLTIQDAKMLANRLTAALPSMHRSAVMPVMSTNHRPRHIHIDHDSSQTQIIIGHRTDAQKTDAKSRQYSSDFSLGNEILAGSDFNARLMKNIREQKGYTYGIYGNLEQLKAAGSYAVRFSTDGNQAAAAIFDTMQIIRQTLDQGITDDELALVRLGNQNGFAQAFSSNASIHRTISALTVADFPKDHLQTRPERLDRATKDSVNQALNTTIRPDQFIIVTVGKSKPDLDQLFQTNNRP